jgi:RNA polymerase sigma-70 factor (ECF subfamily)
MPPGSATPTAPTIDDRTFTQLLQRTMPALRAFVRRLAGSADADDVLQETLAKVWRLRHGFDASRNGAAWLHRAAFRTFCDHRRRDRGRPRAHDMLADAAAPPAPCRTELQDELQHRLAKLPALERELLLGFHQDGLSLKELARRHILALNTVKSHLHRARRRLHAPDEGESS